MAPELSLRALIAVALAFLLLGLTKTQHAGLPLALLVACACTERFRELFSTRRALVFLGILNIAAIAPIFVQPTAHMKNDHAAAIRLANAADTWFGAILPALPAPALAIHELGLPAECEANVGLDWYSPGVDWNTCRGIARVSRVRALFLLLRHPTAIASLLRHAVPATAPWLERGLGHVAGRRFGFIDQLGDVSLWSLARVETSLSRRAYAILVGFLLAASAIGIGALAWSFFLKRARSASFGFGVASVVVFYGLGSSLLGDGYTELSRHFMLGRLALLPALGLGFVWIHRTVRSGASAD